MGDTKKRDRGSSGGWPELVPASTAPGKRPDKRLGKIASKTVGRTLGKTAEKPADKPVDKPADKPVDRAAGKRPLKALSMDRIPVVCDSFVTQP
jgi:hypothetical protein